MLRIVVCGLFLAFMIPPAAHAVEWSAAAKAELQAAGARLRAAKTTEQRVAALREIQRIAEAHPDAPGAQAMARLMAAKATQAAGPKAMIAALKQLAASHKISDIKTFASVAGPLMSTIADMRANGTLLPEAAIQLDAAIKKLDETAQKAGLPKIAEAVDKATGDTKLASKIADAISKIAALAKTARDAPNLGKMNDEAKKEYLDNMVSILPPTLSPAVSGPAFVAVRDELVWADDMYGEGTKGLKLVTQTMATGHFDHKAYDKIQKRLTELSKGPWTSSTVLDFFKALCKELPVGSAWCDDAFGLLEKLLGKADCSSISCDCDHVGGGLARGPLMVQCKLAEQDLISTCKEKKKIVGSCPAGARGPAANPK